MNSPQNFLGQIKATDSSTRDRMDQVHLLQKLVVGGDWGKTWIDKTSDPVR
jgi:hypothetical protein